MKLVLFYHSLLSDWNHGNAHFLRGICSELISRGHEVTVLEAQNNWSLNNLLQEKGSSIYDDFERNYPLLNINFYNDDTDLRKYLQHADLVIVHEWNEHELVKKIGELKVVFNYKLLFHDTHHRAVTDEQNVSLYDLSKYDGVLAYGEVIKNIYLEKGWAKKAWIWHEAADVRIFQPYENQHKKGDLVWIGNWGDDERTEELIEFLIKPVKELSLKAKMYGVRYPEEALRLLKNANIEYGGYLPSYEVPKVFADYHFTIHVPRKPYTQALPGIPTIRPFEALACGIPLISAPWNDCEGLFTEGEDFLMVSNGEEMKTQMKNLLQNRFLRQKLSAFGLQTILKKHTCKQRVNELINIHDQLNRRQLLNL